MINLVSPRAVSIFIHLAFVLIFFLISKFSFDSNKQMLDVPLVFAPLPTEVLNIKEMKEEEKIVLKSINAPLDKITTKKEVFGLNRNSYTDNQSESSTIEVKKGNTITKAADNEVLTAADSDSLPTPTEEYLVSKMPRVISEFRPIYPVIARNNKIEGAVVMSVLIDVNGNVRQIDVIESDDIFKDNAIIAMRKFKFSPALVNGVAVAVKIRYTINFKLEY